MHMQESNSFMSSLTLLLSSDYVMPDSFSPMNSSTPGFPVLYCLPEFAQTHVHWVSDTSESSHLCHPLLLLPSIFPSESAPHIG